MADLKTTALEACRRLFNEALPKFNWATSFLDANAIKLLNEVPAMVDAALSSTKFTVLLLRPDYEAENFGQDTFQAWVEAADVPTAIDAARRQAYIADSHPDDVVIEEARLDDYFVLAAYEGHISDLNPGE